MSLVAVVAVAAVALATPQGIGTEPGQLFPDLELPLVGGEGTLRLSSLRGERVLLIEFASW